MMMRKRRRQSRYARTLRTISAGGNFHLLTRLSPTSYLGTSLLNYLHLLIGIGGKVSSQVKSGKSESKVSTKRGGEQTTWKVKSTKLPTYNSLPHNFG